jgi:hypothetical protein
MLWPRRCRALEALFTEIAAGNPRVPTSGSRTADQILGSIRRYCGRINGSPHEKPSNQLS